MTSTSRTSTIFGWEISASALHSLVNRSTATGSDISFMSLMATEPPVLTSRARQTTPMPPSPSCPWSSYRPAIREEGISYLPEHTLRVRDLSTTLGGKSGDPFQASWDGSADESLLPRSPPEKLGENSEHEQYTPRATRAP